MKQNSFSLHLVRSVYAVGLFFLTLSANGQKKHPAKSENIPPELDAYINRVLSTFEVPGISVSIVQNGKVLMTKGY